MTSGYGSNVVRPTLPILVVLLTCLATAVALLPRSHSSSYEDLTTISADLEQAENAPVSPVGDDDRSGDQDELEDDISCHVVTEWRGILLPRLVAWWVPARRHLGPAPGSLFRPPIASA